MSSVSTPEQDKTLEFIALLHDRPQIWQKEHSDFMNREVRLKTFEEIAKMTGLTEDRCKKKLKHLKDKMRDICNKLPKTKSGEPAFENGLKFVRWPFYKAMLFMKDEFTGRDSGDIVVIESAIQDESQPNGSASSLIDSDEEASYPSAMWHGEVLPHQKQAYKHTQFKKARLDKELIHINRAMASPENTLTLSSLTGNDRWNEPRDEWSAFCSSLAFDLRKLQDPYLVMQVKCDISKVVNDAVLHQLEQDHS